MDFLLEDFGGEIYILRPISDGAKAWTVTNISDFPVFTGGRVVDQRYLGYVRRSVPLAGFTMGETAYGRRAQRV